MSHYHMEGKEKKGGVEEPSIVSHKLSAELLFSVPPPNRRQHGLAHLTPNLATQSCPHSCSWSPWAQALQVSNSSSTRTGRDRALPSKETIHRHALLHDWT